MIPELLQRHTKMKVVEVEAINAIQRECMVFKCVLNERPLAAEPNQDDSFRLNRLAGRSIKPPYCGARSGDYNPAAKEGLRHWTPPSVLVQRVYITQSGGSIAKSIHPNGSYKLAGLGQCSLVAFKAPSQISGEELIQLMKFAFEFEREVEKEVRYHIYGWVHFGELDGEVRFIRVDCTRLPEEPSP